MYLYEQVDSTAAQGHTWVNPSGHHVGRAGQGHIT